MFVVTVDNFVVNLSTSHRLYIEESSYKGFEIIVDYGDSGDDDVLHLFDTNEDAKSCLESILMAIAEDDRVYYIGVWFENKVVLDETQG